MSQMDLGTHTACRITLDCREILQIERDGTLARSQFDDHRLFARWQTLDSWLDFPGARISEELIKEVILQVVLIDDNTVNWTLDLSSHEAGARHVQPSEIALL